MLNAFLDFYRASLLDRAYGLNEEQLQVTLGPSTLSIGRMISHMAWVEYLWFHVRFAGHDMPAPFASLDWDADSDAEMALSSSWTVDELIGHFNDAVLDSKTREKTAVTLDELTAGEPVDKQRQLRWIMIHMIEEYARHCGHADLIRESIDGDTSDW